MKSDDAVRLLSSDHPHDRLRAARALSSGARQADVAAIRKAFAKESVPWVRNALERALQSHSAVERGGPAQDTGEAQLDDATIRDIYVRASEEMVTTLIHEMQPKIGYIRNAAIKEVPNFEQSDTKRRIEYVEDLLGLLAEFRKVSQTPRNETFDLADLIDSVIAETKAQPTQRAGQRPLVVIGDPRRIRLAIANGLRNALEATKAVEDDAERVITVNWGMDNERCWVSIIDQGIGIHGSVEGMFGIGRTTKAEHFGMGLPIARQAMLSMGGDVTLAPGAQGGARFEVSWEKILRATQGEAA